MTRVAVLWTGLSGYFNACLRELAIRPGVELLVAHMAPVGEAPFDDAQFAWMPMRITIRGRFDRDALLERVGSFAPDVLLVSSWHIGAYRHVLRRLRPRPLRVLCMDNQWHGTLKQWMGVLSSSWYVRPLYEAVFLPGERQADFARRLGFPESRIWHGLYCPDAAPLAELPDGMRSAPSHAFGYIGRLAPEKGIEDLLEAYEIYRQSRPDPWVLRVAGQGPLNDVVEGYEHVIRSGFVQPAGLAEWMEGIGCLVVPSRFEPWGVVISEGAWAGLPMIVTNACGAAPHLVHDFVNGRVARSGDVQSLVECLVNVSNASDDKLLAMGRISRGLASPYTPGRWADTVIARTTESMACRVP
jgi:glycosyltransferase involved in cell wall biosynthesis